MKRIIPVLVVMGLVIATGLTACASNTGPGGPSRDGSTYVSDGTFTFAILTDPGSLDPQLSALAGVFEMTGYAYDSIVGQGPDGEILPQLAKSWTSEANKASFVINDGITCSDGSTLTAKTIADNINWMGDPNNGSYFLGAFLPVGITASADEATNTLTFDLAVPAPFLLTSIASLPIVCDAGMADRDQLAGATLGSGPYVLTEAVPDDHYTYERRDGYTWGPGGATTAEPGLPKTLVVKIVPNESTAVNMLLSNEVNLATTVGPDGARAESAGIPAADVPAILGLTWYNHAEGHPTADPAVRKALTQAVNLDDLATAITAGAGSRATMMAAMPPTTCDYDAVSGNLPAFDTAAAGATLEQAGYTKASDGKYAKDGKPLTIKFFYDSAQGTSGQAAAELALKQWDAAGFTIEVQQLDTTRFSEVLFGTGAWDMAWEPINLNSPDQLVGFLSGPSVEEGGGNFTSLANSGYESAVAEAMTKTGQEACESFKQAEAALYSNDDLVVWAVRPNKIYYAHSEYVYVGKTQVTSLRLLEG